MKRFRLLRPHYINGALMGPGAVIERDNDFAPSQFMEEVKEPAAAEPQPEQGAAAEAAPASDTAAQTGSGNAA